MSNAPESPRHRNPAGRIHPRQVRPLPAPAGPGLRYRSWIDLPGSMTRALAHRFGETPSVTPTFEGPGRPAPWEARLLRAAARRVYVREVTLSVRGSPVVHARTLSRLDDPAVDVLQKLSDRPLAEVLFEDPRWQRLTPPIPVMEVGSRRPGRVSLWGYHARGRHPAGGSRILVSEYFQPTMACHLADGAAR